MGINKSHRTLLDRPYKADYPEQAERAKRRRNALSLCLWALLAIFMAIGFVGMARGLTDAITH